MAKKSLTFDIFGRDKTASKTFRDVGASADGMGKKLARVGNAIGVGLAAASVGAVAFGVDSVKAFAEAEQAQMKLADAFKRFPKLADKNIKSFTKLNSALAKKTRFDDDATAAGQATLAQYGLTGAQILKLTPLMQDYAAKTGKDLPDAALALGKAMLGQGRALKDIGVDFEDTKSLAGNFDSVMGSLKEKVGGFAEGEATQASVKLEILKNRFGEIKEKVGEALIPAMDEAATSMDETLMPILEDAATWMATTGIPALADFAKGFSDIQKASYDFGYNMGPNLDMARAELADFFLSSEWTKFWKGVGAGLFDLGIGNTEGLWATERKPEPQKAGKRKPPALSGAVLPTPKQRTPAGSAFGAVGGRTATVNVYPSAGMSEHTIGNVAANGINRKLRGMG